MTSFVDGPKTDHVCEWPLMLGSSEEEKLKTYRDNDQTGAVLAGPQLPQLTPKLNRWCHPATPQHM